MRKRMMCCAALPRGWSRLPVPSPLVYCWRVGLSGNYMFVMKG